jgi:hypothetical protein
MEATSGPRQAGVKALAMLAYSALCIGAGWALNERLSATDAPMPQAQVQSPSPAPAPAAPVRLHNYDSRDGMAYGYTAAITPEQRQAGRVSESVVMFFYAGQREGRHQVHIYEGSRVTAAECAAPCDVIKVLTVMDLDSLRGNVSVEYMRNAPGVIAGLALQDALAGKLEPYAEIQPDGRFEVWVDQLKGLRRTRSKG